jgi:hypothetical protein
LVLHWTDLYEMHLLSVLAFIVLPYIFFTQPLRSNFLHYLQLTMDSYLTTSEVHTIKAAISLHVVRASPPLLEVPTLNALCSVV